MKMDELDAYRRTVATRSGELSYIDVGTGDVALFLHGVGTNAYLWRHVVAGVRDVRRCIALDLPLHGGSPVNDGQDFSLGGLAGVVADFCDALGLDRIDLVANDTGGAVAQVFAVRNPRRLRTFTLTNCDVHTNLPPESFRDTVELARRGELAPAAAALVASPELARAGGAFSDGFEHPERLTDEEVLAYLRPVFGTEFAARAFERLLTSLDAAELVALEPDLRRLEVPTLLVWGTADENFGPEWADWLADRLPGVVGVVLVEGGKMFFPLERADELVAPLRELWAR